MKKYAFWVSSMVAVVYVVFIISVIYYVTFNCFKCSKSYETVDVFGLPEAEKSSLQREFQYLMIPNVWSQLGIDNLFDKRIYSVDKQKIKNFFHQ